MGKIAFGLLESRFLEKLDPADDA